MASYHVYYMRPEWFRKGICGAKPAGGNLDATHVRVKTITAESLGHVFNEMQGEVWSPNGEARLLIRALGLEHTSMSVGDVVVDRETGLAYVVARIGFEQLT